MLWVRIPLLGRGGERNGKCRRESAVARWRRLPRGIASSVTILQSSPARLYLLAGAGFLGALTGLGGGVVVVPLLAPGPGRGPPIRHWRFADFGHRHLVRGGRGLRQGRLCQHPHRHVPGSGHDLRALVGATVAGSLPTQPSPSSSGSCCCSRLMPRGGCRRTGPGLAPDPRAEAVAAQRRLSRRWRSRAVRRRAPARRLRHDVRGRAFYRVCWALAPEP